MPETPATLGLVPTDADAAAPAEVIEYRPSSGGGSCASCRAALGLDAVRRREGASAYAWFCSPSCAQGMSAAGRRQSAVEEPRLYNRPRRFHRRRRPKELHTSLDHGPVSSSLPGLPDRPPSTDAPAS